MNRLFSARPFVAAAVALGAVVAASAAHARTDVVLSIGMPVQYGYAQPYVQPQPVYVQPQAVYVQPQPYYYVNQSNWERRREWERRRAWAQHRNGPWGDADRDGVPNRYDHAPNNPYRR